jgi:class 3 adenylate cyclase
MLPSIGVPTLVLHRSDDAIEPVGAGRYLGQVIPNAEYVELPGADHLPWAGDQDALIREVERFFNRVWRDEEETLERVLATVMFTDIVDSTAQAATMGDGFLAVFDGPARAARCASAICESVGRLGVELRAGIHTGGPARR